MSLTLDTTKLPQRISKKFYSLLTEEQKKLVDDYRREKKLKANSEAMLAYQKRNPEKVNEYQRQRQAIKRAEKIKKNTEGCFLVK